MDTKHKPATALPWVSNGNSGIVWSKQNGLHIPVLHAQKSPGDGVYAEHACNAYPRLVEALRVCAEVCGAADAAGTAQHGEYAAGEAVNALLRELGEAQ